MLSSTIRSGDKPVRIVLGGSNLRERRERLVLKGLMWGSWFVRSVIEIVWFSGVLSVRNGARILTDHY